MSQTIDRNQIRSNALIALIARNKHLDLRGRAAQIHDQLLGDNRALILQYFNVLIDLNHAQLHGLGTDHHADRPGGWGFAAKDDKFLSSLRGHHLSHIYGIMHGPGRYTMGPLTKKQVAALGRCMANPFYTLQLALCSPEVEGADPDRKCEAHDSRRCRCS